MGTDNIGNNPRIPGGSAPLPKLPDPKDPKPVTPAATPAATTPRSPTDMLQLPGTKRGTGLTLSAVVPGTGNLPGAMPSTPQEEAMVQQAAVLSQGLAAAQTGQQLQALVAKAADARKLAEGATGPIADNLRAAADKTEKAVQAYQLAQSLGAATDPKARAAAIAGILAYPGGPAGVQAALGPRAAALPGVGPQLADPAKLENELATTLAANPDITKFPPGTGTRLAALQPAPGSKLAQALDKASAYAVKHGGFLGIGASSQLSYDQVSQRPDVLALAARAQNDPAQAADFEARVVQMGRDAAQAHTDKPDATLATRLAGVQADLKAWEAAGVKPETIAKARQAAMKELGLDDPSRLRQALDDSLASRADKPGVSSDDVFKGLATDVQALKDAGFDPAQVDAANQEMLADRDNMLQAQFPGWNGLTRFAVGQLDGALTSTYGPVIQDFAGEDLGPLGYLSTSRLDPGESHTFKLGADVQAGPVNLGADAGVQITRVPNPDGKGTSIEVTFLMGAEAGIGFSKEVERDVAGEVTLKGEVNANLGVNAKMAFTAKFDMTKPEDVAALRKMSAALAGNVPAIGDQLVPPPPPPLGAVMDEFKSHMTASGWVAGVQATLEVSGTATGPGDLEAKATIGGNVRASYGERLEYENGKPVAKVASFTAGFKVEGQANAGDLETGASLDAQASLEIRRGPNGELLGVGLKQTTTKAGYARLGDKDLNDRLEGDAAATVGDEDQVAATWQLGDLKGLEGLSDLEIAQKLVSMGVYTDPKAAGMQLARIQATDSTNYEYAQDLWVAKIEVSTGVKHTRDI